ncbi:MAG: DUF3450 family protein [Planctomycetes bacterium]|nr:DUF3450 family protein [Planctomycetota bacterium]
MRGRAFPWIALPLPASLALVIPVWGTMLSLTESAFAQAQQPPKSKAAAPIAPATKKSPAAPAAKSATSAAPATTPPTKPATTQPPQPTSQSSAEPASADAPPAQTAQPASPSAPAKAPPTLEETRLTLSKWIETQQIISKERNDWQQGKEILQGRIELVGKEVSQLGERIAQSEAAVVESHKKRDDLAAQNEQLKEVGAQLAGAVTEMESQVRKLSKLAPEGVLTRLTPLLQRIPTDPEKTRISTAERFQNVLGILNELNKANSEITIAYEIRQLSDGSSSEVQVIYVGLAQAYFLSPRGEAGIGKPSENGWQWRAANDQAGAILTALEIIQGKHPPAFVALPITIQ